ncbi:MAG: hypothetical protein HPY76_13290 [Anaerolineae bacterium]|nr:hypothetical protein [Anaerolineae bacterium]
MLVQEITLVKEKYKKILMGYPNVVGVGTGMKVSGGQETGDMCIVALVRQKLPAQTLSAEATLPTSVGGIDTDVWEVGDLMEHSLNSARQRPAQPGCSIGHSLVTAGTLGCMVRDREHGVPLILSNNHVLANCNVATPGDAILQPGAADGGTLAQDTLAYLTRFIPLRFDGESAQNKLPDWLLVVLIALAGFFEFEDWKERLVLMHERTNLMDAAVARPVAAEWVSAEIPEIGLLAGMASPMLGMAVRKQGRTSGLTHGQVNVVHTTVMVNYSNGRVARFDDQVVTTAMSQGGDSGSLVVSGEPPLATGLLFAGSPQASIFTPITTVLDALDVTL